MVAIVAHCGAQEPTWIFNDPIRPFKERCLDNQVSTDVSWWLKYKSTFWDAKKMGHHLQLDEVGLTAKLVDSLRQIEKNNDCSICIFVSLKQ